jgi:MFS family permease
MPTRVPRRILPVIVLSQFAGTSLWFAVNAVMPDLQQRWGFPDSALGTLTSAVQLGFVAGTLVFALLMLSDRFPPALVFLACSVLGALLNLVVLVVDGRLGVLIVVRFAVGFMLAGVYPVGMKIAASWYREGLGAAMGVLIGALVLGTALPHGLRAWAGGTDSTALSFGSLAPWQAVVISVSVLAALGGLATALLVPSPPGPPAGTRITPRALGVIWSDVKVRASVFGYFGHMWELYAMFVLVPVVLGSRLADDAISAAAFWVIGAGFFGCVAGGLAGRRLGSARVAQFQLTTSGLCCLAAPLMLVAPLPLFIAWMVLWGATVSGDSPQFSTLTAQNAPPAVVGSVLTVSNSIGFGISVVSIELFVRAAAVWPLAQVLPWLALGPLIGLWMLNPLLNRNRSPSAQHRST